MVDRGWPTMERAARDPANLHFRLYGIGNLDLEATIEVLSSRTTSP